MTGTETKATAKAEAKAEEKAQAQAKAKAEGIPINTMGLTSILLQQAASRLGEVVAERARASSDVFDFTDPSTRRAQFPPRSRSQSPPRPTTSRGLRPL